ncbi:DUF3667 domain-containing protein [Rehaibacterium terrae]|jgi:hypothetical protein|uniref:DUF3667 domain-containing protein n=1 Tax=Rehaibacterium terrae TaxID=1341696 RepID=A0A7W7V8S9_9GAMM|nr:DUF3667 domain-containing protein [Rehaibacterium terrae]MBB5014745.1 hypothetical protein [Rehaibacterium terrae]
MTATATAPAGDPGRCQNCGVALHGPHCHACGQPVKGAVRHFGSLIGDVLDTVFEYDNRLWRTLLPLVFRPGHLSNEYLAGRRVRYVSPFRLFFFITVIAFLLAQLSFDVDDGNGAVIQTGDSAGFSIDGERIGDATTVDEVERRRDAILAHLDERLAELDGPAAIAARAGIEGARAGVVAEARRRIAQIERGEVDAAAPATAHSSGPPQIRFGGGLPWDRETNPVRLPWLPDAGNDWLNRQIERGQKNIARVQEEPNLLKDAILGALPTTFFILLPLFALLLKFAYLFKRRLYMEHLIVALHSHAFLSMALLLILVLDALREWTGQAVFGWLEVALAAWMPLYLLLTQKRVYRQGWLMTLLKFAVIGIVYLSMLTTGVVLTVMAAIVWL